MPSFGEKLKKEREKRSITLEQISLSTKIGTRMLQALEEDKFGQLPGGIFNKGFVRAYARYVGLDEDQTVADYLQASGEAPQPPLAETSEPQLRIVENRPAPSASRPLPWGVFAAILLVAALMLSIWSRRQHTPEHPPAPPAEDHKAEGTVSPTSSKEEPSVPPTDSTAASETPPLARPDSTPVAAPQVLSAPPKTAVHTATSTTAEPPAGQFTVVVIARQDSWISITQDGKPAFTETLSAGDQRAFHARNQVLLKTGNTGALDFLFNGKKLPAQGEYGQVKTITFSSDGLQPSPSSTPATQ